MRRMLSAAALMAPMLGRAEDADTEQRIARLSQRAIGANIRADLMALDALLADGYVVISPFGEVVTKAGHLNYVKDGTLHLDSIEPPEVKVRVYGNAAVLTRAAGSR